MINFKFDETNNTINIDLEIKVFQPQEDLKGKQQTKISHTFPNQNCTRMYLVYL